jgi:hypothetical protein
MTLIPPFIASLADDLASMPGVVAVVLGGSRAIGAASAASDWDLGVYYRGDLETSALARRGTVHPPGSWGRIMNGGAWLSVDGTKVDVLLRDLDVVEDWSARAREGVFEIDALLGYVAGVPTYSLLAERAVAVVLRGELPPLGEREVPSKLAREAERRWRFHVDFTFEYARMHARRGDAVGACGQVSKGIFEEAHARVCARRRWVLNEKGLVEAAGLSEVQRWFAAVPDDLLRWVNEVRAGLEQR